MGQGRIMEEVKYISVKEFAEKAGIARQNIYKAYNNPKSKIYPYVKVLPRGIFISTQALTDLYDNKDNCEQPTIDELEQQKPVADKELEGQRQEKTTPIDTFGYSVYNDFVNHLQTEIKQEQSKYNQLSTQIDRLNDIIQEKDRIIAEQARQITALNQSMVELSNKALTTATNQQTLSAMEKQPLLDNQDNVAQPRKGIIKRLFGI